MDTNDKVRSDLKRILTPVEQVNIEGMKPVYIRHDGLPMFSPEDSVILAKYLAEQEKLRGKQVSAGTTEMNKDGSYTGFNKKWGTVVPEVYYENYCREVEIKKEETELVSEKDPETGKTKKVEVVKERTIYEYHVVNDDRVLKSRRDNRVTENNIPTYVFTVTKDGKLRFERKTHIGAKEFVEHFKEPLSHELMAKFKPLINAAEMTGQQGAIEKLKK